MSDYVATEVEADGKVWLEPVKRLIHCGECRYQRYDIRNHFLYCSFAKLFPLGEDKDYCSMAERKDDDR